MTVGSIMSSAWRAVGDVGGGNTVDPAYFLCAEAAMRVSDEATKCVAFVSRYAQEFRFGGTAFVVGVPMGEDHVFGHLVTAKHVAEAIDPGEAAFAFNGRDGHPFYAVSGGQEWFYHPTEPNAVDVAVMPFGTERQAQYDMQYVQLSDFATDEVIAEQKLGIGDEIIAIGLFTEFYGKHQLTPIIRTGNIAMMPRERIPVEHFEPMEAYLAEGRSIGGLSGSPVFVRPTVNIPIPTAQGIVKVAGLGNRAYLLGLLHGHFRLPAKFSGDATKREWVHMGVSIVTPAKKIIEVLNHPRLVEMRNEQFKKGQEIEKRQSTTQDSAFEVFTKENFEDALKKVSRKRE